MENKMIIQYETIQEKYISKLDDNINKYIASGWEPQGGICTVQYGNGDIYYLQAMIKVAKEKTEE